MTYGPTVWVDYVSPPCINAANLNNMENGIDRAQGDVMNLYDTTANIPISDPLLVGRLYFETDLLRRVWRDNGGGWDLVVAGPGYPNALLATGQQLCLQVGDDGDVEAGDVKAYTVIATPGNTDVETAWYAAATLSFTAPNTIADAAGGLAGWLVNDRMMIKGSGGNDGEVTVTGIGGAPNNLTISAAVNEIAGAMISLYKVDAHSNNVVQDDNTGVMWLRFLGSRMLNFYDAATRFTIYNAANTISCIAASNTFRVIGGAALTQFHVGDAIMCAGFANAVNNLAFMVVVSATPNGADLDIVVDPGNNVLIAEGAVGDTVYLNCRSMFNFLAGANAAGVSGYTDWRIANLTEMYSVADYSTAPITRPDAIAFPVWYNAYFWSSTHSGGASAYLPHYATGVIAAAAKTLNEWYCLVRLGI